MLLTRCGNDIDGTYDLGMMGGRLAGVGQQYLECIREQSLQVLFTGKRINDN
jgi:hypothetical protein